MWWGLLLLGLGAAARPCIPSGNEIPINDALAQGGKGAVVELCAGSVHRLQDAIRFTAPGQSLLTAKSNGAEVTGHSRAMLIVEGDELSTAIFADCKQCGDATIKNLVIDGNRPQLLRVPLGGALIEVGNAERQSVTGCRLYEPRGWSALHIREGDNLNCRRAYIADNVIGPCGEEWDDDYDGLIEKEPPFGNPRADGISIACKDSVVERNTVFDTTDGAIVIFGSSGTQVRENTVSSRTRVVLGGINLVDYDPWKGDYTNVKVYDNKLHAPSGYFKVGIVVGPSSWSDDTDTTVHGASVTDNHFSGERFGYAMVVSSASSFTVQGNVVDPDAKFIGVPGPSCPTAPENGPPTPFLLNRGSAQGAFQPEFKNGEVQHIICVNPPDEHGKPYKAWRLRDSPAAVAARQAEAAEAGQIPAGMDVVLSDALVAYQHTLIMAMDDIEAELNVTAGKDKGKPSSGDDTVVERADPLTSHLESLERSGKKLKESLAHLEMEITKLANKVEEQSDVRKPILQNVYNSVRKMKPGGKAKGRGRGARELKATKEPKLAKGPKQVKSKSKSQSQKRAAHRLSSYGLVPLLVLGVGGVVLAAYIVQRRRGGLDLDMKIR